MSFYYYKDIFAKYPVSTISGDNNNENMMISSEILFYQTRQMQLQMRSIVNLWFPERVMMATLFGGWVKKWPSHG